MGGMAEEIQILGEITYVEWVPRPNHRPQPQIDTLYPAHGTWLCCIFCLGIRDYSSVVAWVIQESRGERGAGRDWQGAGSTSTGGVAWLRRGSKSAPQRSPGTS